MSRVLRPPTAAGGASLALCAGLLTGCGSQHSQHSQHTGADSITAVPAPASPTAPVPHAAPVTATPSASAAALADATRQYATQPSPASLPPGATTALAGIDYQDPLAVSRAYLQARWTYRYTDTAGYTTALAAPQLTTAAFAARSSPTAAAVAQLRTAQESSSATVLSAGYSREAPSTAATSYVTAQFAVTATYRGAGSGSTERHIWSLRLTAAAGQWRVDGVVVAD